MGTAVGDLKMGRKPATWDELESRDLEAGLSNKMLDDKDGGSDKTYLEVNPTGDESLEVNPTLPSEGLEGWAAGHISQSSWGRSGSWEMSPEALGLTTRAGESNRVGGGVGSGSDSMNAGHQ